MADQTTLQAQLEGIAAEFAADDTALGDLLEAIAADVARGSAEPLEIFPVAHHSPSSALHLVKRLQDNPPKVIYIELCEDMLSIVENLRDCKLPVALQVFAAESADLPPEKLPASVVAPLTECSAEYQAIAYCLNHPETALVFVDRAADYVFQWDRDEKREDDDNDEEEAQMHGTAKGVQVGSLMPTFDTFLEYLLKHSRTRHFSEWWDQYVEQAIIGADYETYRQVMFMVGSLIRRLGRREKDVESDRLREQYMWTKMKSHMKANGIAPHEAIHICGAAHTASDVPQFGTGNDLTWEIPPQTDTKWLYGLLPSSFAAIAYQFSHPVSTITLAEATWKKSLRSEKLRPFVLDKKKKKRAKPRKKPAVATGAAEPTQFLTRPPELQQEDTEQLLDWCAKIVGLARKNGYLASTADSIAIYQTSILLANMRSRAHPTPYDFTDAAITCLEKDRTPRKRNIAHLCHILLGGGRTGTVGYKSLPPLAQNVYDRLAPLNKNLAAKTNQRALCDYKGEPHLLPCSDVLWRLNWLLGNHAVQPIMGERTLGSVPVQESWELRIGKYQGQLIQLGYEGVTIEQVIAQRLKKRAFVGDDVSAAQALEAAEDALLYLNQPRLTHELGAHATYLLSRESSVGDAPDIFKRVRRLVHHYRTTPDGLPDWLGDFVRTGYAHYATLLPKAFEDRGASPEQVAGMLAFIFTLESVALSLGCSRSQLLIAVQQTGQLDVDASKLGLLWTTELLLKQRDLAEIRAFFDDVLANPLRIGAFPDYLNGFLLSLEFAPRIGRFLVELLSKVFATVPDAILMPWLPTLILRLRAHPQTVQTLIKEVAFAFPNDLAALEQWQPSWDAVEVVEKQDGVAVSAELQPIHTCLATHPATLNYLKVGAWRPVVVDVGDSAGLDAVPQLLANYPTTMHHLTEGDLR